MTPKKKPCSEIYRPPLFCKKTGPIWYSLASAASFLIYPSVYGVTTLCYISIPRWLEKYSTAMCYGSLGLEAFLVISSTNNHYHDFMMIIKSTYISVIIVQFQELALNLNHLHIAFNLIKKLHDYIKSFQPRKWRYENQDTFTMDTSCVVSSISH